MDSDEEDAKSSSQVPGPHAEDESDPTSQQLPRGWKTVMHHPLDLVIGNSHASQVVPKTIDQAIVSIGDDCIAINGGSSYINATRLVCGPDHGMSIGLGKDHSYETVEEVHVHNCTFIGTTNGARIKTFLGGSGYARKITFDQIYLQNVSNPIIIDQHYGDSYVEVSEVTYHGIDGTSASDIAIKLDCSSLGCSNIVMDQINIVSSQKEKKVNAFCQNLQGTIESTVPKSFVRAFSTTKSPLYKMKGCHKGKPFVTAQAATKTLNRYTLWLQRLPQMPNYTLPVVAA
ncbi:probable polygalacturonase At3g15720 [Cicer arietinum]|uniref:probable polygalacturonase At3g15720 n=1 Tax=Cicer arietinum TaxID=3827 RepID=UPI003CC5CAF9